MAGIATRQHGSEADYEAIELAVMETERGRWFLAEYAKRNRHADTETLLSALSRIERSVGAQRAVADLDKSGLDKSGVDAFRLDILEMSKAIARTHAEIAAIRPDDAKGGRLQAASGELDSIVSTTETATSDILLAAERVQEAAWTLREANADAGLCDMLDARATEIYTACSFQDLTAQRIRKVIEALGFLEKRLGAMVEIWQFAETGDGPAEATATAKPGLPALAGPAAGGMSQADVDDMLVTAPAPPKAAPAVEAEAEAIDEMLFAEPTPPRPPAAVDAALGKVRGGAALSADEAARALDALKAMSIEERTRLFS